MEHNCKVKIFHVVHSLRVGGLEQVVVNLINSLPPERYEHVVCCIDTSGPMQDRLKFPIKVYELGKGAGCDYLVFTKIAQVIREEKPKILHTRNWSAIDGVIAAILSGVPHIIHDEHGRDANDPLGANLKRRLFRKLVSPWVARFIPVSTELERWLVDAVGIKQRSIKKILNGVDTDRFFPTADKKSAKRVMGLDPDAFAIGFAGRLDPVKDVNTLLEAFSDLVSRSGSKSQLVIVGDGSERAKLEMRCQTLQLSGHVVFTGQCSRLDDLMRSLDLFALTSIAEGIPMTILEAMATGLPVVATNVGGVGEVVEDGVTGSLVPVKAVHETANALSLYTSSPQLAAAHGAEGRKRVVNNFSLRSMVASYDDLYRSLVTGAN